MTLINNIYLPKSIKKLKGAYYCCIGGSHYSGGRTNQGGRSNRGSTVSVENFSTTITDCNREIQDYRFRVDVFANHPKADLFCYKQTLQDHDFCNYLGFPAQIKMSKSVYWICHLNIDFY